MSTHSHLTDVRSALAARGIARVRHFTTNAGITGILATGAVSSRDLLAENAYLDQIYLPNCEVRLDPAWTGYVSASVTDINATFFSICSGSANWHAGMDGFWAVVDFDPEVLTDDGVYFTTTNNRYTNVQRAVGVDGFEAMFAEVVYPYWPIDRSPVLRRGNLPPHQTTDPQAEVLLPGSVPAERITGIVVATDADAISVRSQVDYWKARTLGVGDIPVHVEPSAFQARILAQRSLRPSPATPAPK